MTFSERQAEIRAITQELEELAERASAVAESSGNTRHFEAYGRYGFDQLLGMGNSYDSSLADLVNEEE